MNSQLAQLDACSLSEKVLAVFGSAATDKRRVPSSQLHKRGIPPYVAERILDSKVPGIGPLTPDQAELVRRWVEEHLPLPGAANEVKNRLLVGETIRVLTPVQVEVILKKSKQERIAKLPLLEINDASIASELVESYPALLKQGLWGVARIVRVKDATAVVDFQPMQSSVDIRLYKEARAEFTTQEWIALLVGSMGYSPRAYTETQQRWLLCRLLPLVQKSLHMIELAPKGTGKSWVFGNISPLVKLISGGNITPAGLFVNNSTGQWGVLERFRVVVLDEVQTLKFQQPEEIVGGLKGFLANGQISAGAKFSTASDCSLVLLANIELDSHGNPVKHILVQELPPFLQETAFLDRLKALLPGWLIPKLTPECYADGVALKADVFGEVLFALREDLEADQYVQSRLSLKGSNSYTRNVEAVRSAAAGLLKLLFPDLNLSDEDFYTYCVLPAVQLRQGIWRQLYELDAEYRQYDATIEAEIRPQ
jgi:ATP-dependent Lon protease